MVIADGGEFFGSVSGGCVEQDVTRQAELVLQDGVPRVAGYSKVEDPELEVGLNCDGIIDLLLEPLTEELLSMLERPAQLTLLTRFRTVGETEVADLEHRLVPNEELTGDARHRTAFCRTSEAVDGEWIEIFEPRVPSPLFLIFGAGTVAYPLSTFGRAMGFRVVVADPRGTYAQADHFPDAHEVICAWPKDLPERLGTGDGGLGERAAVVSLTHEPRFEDDLLRTLMTVPPPAYLGAMGKRERHREREARQAASGFDLAKLPPVHTPIGLDLGGKAPEDIALSIMAEIQALRHGKTGEPLSERARDGDGFARYVPGRQ